MYERRGVAWVWDRCEEASMGSIWFWGAFAGIWLLLVTTLTIQSSGVLPALSFIALATYVLVFARGWRLALKDDPRYWNYAVDCYFATCLATHLIHAMVRYL